MGRGADPQNAESGKYFWCLNKKLHFTTGLFRACEERSGRKSTHRGRSAPAWTAPE